MRFDSGMQRHMRIRASTNALGWQLAALLFAGATIGASAFGLMEYRAAHSLSAQLDVATADAKHAHEEAARLKNQLSMDTPRR